VKLAPIAPATSQADDLPRITPDLAKWLKDNYSPRAPGLSTPDREIWFHAGQWDLAQRLLTIFDKSQETSS